MQTKEEVRKREKHTRYLRSVGKSTLVPAEASIARVRLLHDAHGMTIAEIARRSGKPPTTIRDLYQGARCNPNRRLRSVRRTTAVALEGVEPAPVPTGPLPGAPAARLGARVDATGALRRLDALTCAGWPVAWIERTRVGMRLEVARFPFGEEDRPDVIHVWANEKICAAYAELLNKNPSDYGITVRVQKRVKRSAFYRDAAPAHCWDPDTIDDPSRVPEWTGECGTVKGYGIHVRESHVFWKINPQAKKASHGVSVKACAACRKANFDARHQ